MKRFHPGRTDKDIRAMAGKLIKDGNQEAMGQALMLSDNIDRGGRCKELIGWKRRECARLVDAILEMKEQRIM